MFIDEWNGTNVVAVDQCLNSFKMHQTTLFSIEIELGGGGGGGGVRENKKVFIFTPVYWGEKIKLYFFPTTLEKEGKYISSADWLVWAVSVISNSKMTLATEKGETSNNILTIYPI